MKRRSLKQSILVIPCAAGLIIGVGNVNGQPVPGGPGGVVPGGGVPPAGGGVLPGGGGV